MSNLTCVLIQSLKLDDGGKDSYSKNVIKFGEKMLVRVLLKEVTLCRV